MGVVQKMTAHSRRGAKVAQGNRKEEYKALMRDLHNWLEEGDDVALFVGSAAEAGLKAGAIGRHAAKHPCGLTAQSRVNEDLNPDADPEGAYLVWVGLNRK